MIVLLVESVGSVRSAGSSHRSRNNSLYTDGDASDTPDHPVRSRAGPRPNRRNGASAAYSRRNVAWDSSSENRYVSAVISSSNLP